MHEGRSVIKLKSCVSQKTGFRDDSRNGVQTPVSARFEYQAASGAVMARRHRRNGQWRAYLVCQETFGSLTPACFHVFLPPVCPDKSEELKNAF